MSDIPADVMKTAHSYVGAPVVGENLSQSDVIATYIARAILAERERIAKRIEETYRNEEGEALRATFVVPDAKDGILQAWHQASDVADFVRYNPEPT